jgi:hypothetical protein
MVYLVVWGFAALAVCVCFMSFAFFYAFMPEYSQKNGEMRSLSGIMKSPELKSYFCFVMGCLGGSLFLASGLRTFSEVSLVRTEFTMALLVGMYVSLVGLVSYDVKYNKTIHYSFVFALILFGGVFGNYVSWHNSWCFAVAYDVTTSVFILCFLYNWAYGGHRTLQACLEILWVVCLIALMAAYAFDDDAEPRVEMSWVLNVCLCGCVGVVVIVSIHFYITPGIGYDSESCKGFSSIVAKIDPHFAFLLKVMFGFLALALGRRSLHTPDALILEALLFVCATGFLSFDLKSNSRIHMVFAFAFGIDALFFSFFYCQDNNDWQRVGFVCHITATGMYVFIGSIFYCTCNTNTAAKGVSCVLQIVWMLGMAFMFTAYLWS